ncbi:MAG: hypothetical protein ACTJLM_01700 [Ehrlichia sp.]
MKLGLVGNLAMEIMMSNYTNITIKQTTPFTVNTTKEGNHNLTIKTIPTILTIIFLLIIGYITFRFIQKGKSLNISNASFEPNEAQQSMLNRTNSRETHRHNFINFTLEEELDPDDISEETAMKLANVDSAFNTCIITGKSDLYHK